MLFFAALLFAPVHSYSAEIVSVIADPRGIEVIESKLSEFNGEFVWKTKFQGPYDPCPDWNEVQKSTLRYLPDPFVNLQSVKASALISFSKPQDSKEFTRWTLKQNWLLKIQRNPLLMLRVVPVCMGAYPDGWGARERCTLQACEVGGKLYSGGGAKTIEIKTVDEYREFASEGFSKFLEGYGVAHDRELFVQWWVGPVFGHENLFFHAIKGDPNIEKPQKNLQQPFSKPKT